MEEKDIKTEKINPDDVEVIDENETEKEGPTSAEMAARLAEDVKTAMSMAKKSASKGLAKASKEAGKTAKEVAKTASEKATKVKEETVKAAKETMEKVKEKRDCKTELFVQYQGRETRAEDLIEKVKSQYLAEGHDAVITSLKIYVKPEENCAYYVVNGESAGQVQM